MTLIYGLLLLLFFVLANFVLSNNKHQSKEHLDANVGSAYIYETGNATFGTLNITGMLNAGPSKIDKSGVSVGPPAVGVNIDDITGKLTIGNVVSLDNVGGLSVGGSVVTTGTGNVGNIFTSSAAYTSGTALTLDGNNVTIAPDSLSIKGNIICGGTVFGSDGTIKKMSGTTVLGTILDTNNNFSPTSIKNMSGNNPVISIVPDGTTNGTIVVNGAIKLGNTVQLVVNPLGHGEFTVGQSTIIYGVDGTMRRYKA